jgi:hypothetical protein
MATFLCTSDIRKKKSTFKGTVRKYIYNKRVSNAFSAFRKMNDVRKSSSSRKSILITDLPYMELKPGDSLRAWYWPDVEGEGCKKRLVQIALVDNIATNRSTKSGLAWSGPFCIDGVGEYSLFVKDPRRPAFPHIVHIDVSKVFDEFHICMNIFVIFSLAFSDRWFLCDAIA